jgi:hypothetical protein
METLASRIEREGALNTTDAVGWIVRLARSLEHLHERGDAHGRVSPHCLLISLEDCASPGRMLGPSSVPDLFAYRSPERLAGGEATAGDDTWALAATLYEAISGTPPFSGESDEELRTQITLVRPAPLAVFDVGDDDLQLILDNALMREWMDRTPDVALLRRALEAWRPDARYAALPPLDDASRATAAGGVSLPSVADDFAAEDDEGPTLLAQRPAGLDKFLADLAPARPAREGRAAPVRRATLPGTGTGLRYDRKSLQERLRASISPGDSSASPAPTAPAPEPTPPPRPLDKTLVLDEEAALPIIPVPAMEPPPIDLDVDVPTLMLTPEASAAQRESAPTSREATPPPEPGHDGAASGPKPPAPAGPVPASKPEARTSTPEARTSTPEPAPTSKPEARTSTPEPAPREAPAALAPAPPPQKKAPPYTMIFGAVIVVLIAIGIVRRMPGTPAPAPSASASSPVTMTAAPEATTAASVATSAAPVATSAAPVATSAAPVATSAAPVAISAAPVATSAAPVATSAAPVAASAAPAATSAVPAATSAAPAVAPASGDVSACMRPLFAPDTFGSESSLDFAPLCQETDPRRGSLMIKSRVVLGSGGRLTDGKREWALVGWYEMAVFAVIRGRCCPSAAPLKLPEPAASCSATDQRLNDLAAAVIATSDAKDKKLKEAVDQYTKAIYCLVRNGQAAAYARTDPPQGGEDTAFLKMLSRVVASNR